MDEEGEVTVRAVEHPTDEDGYSLITKGWPVMTVACLALTERNE
jgi:hypothetical protein